jgi:hypothetical protein
MTVPNLSVAPARARKRPRGAARRPVGLHRLRVSDFEFDNEIGGHSCLPWLLYAGFAAYDDRAAEPRHRAATSSGQTRLEN